MQYFDDSLKDLSFAEIGERLRAEVDAAEHRLRALSDAQAGQLRDGGRWSGKQILGHLIDSAANNHQRFVRAQGVPVPHLPGYAQDHWVSVQHYDARSWNDLVDLWCNYNRHLGHVIARIPESLRTVVCEIGGGPPVPLSYVALDYVGHAEHHLRQIF